MIKTEIGILDPKDIKVCAGLKVKENGDVIIPKEVLKQLGMDKVKTLQILGVNDGLYLTTGKGDDPSDIAIKLYVQNLLEEGLSGKELAERLEKTLTQVLTHLRRETNYFSSLREK